MKCPAEGCGSATRVLDSRDTADSLVIRRRRVCTDGHRFTTNETVIVQEPVEQLRCGYCSEPTGKRKYCSQTCRTAARTKRSIERAQRAAQMVKGA